MRRTGYRQAGYLTGAGVQLLGWLLAGMLTLGVLAPFVSASQEGGRYLYVFSSKERQATVIDTRSGERLGTWSIGFRTVWVADVLRSFDGEHLWTYDLRQDGDTTQVDVVAFNPRTLQVDKRVHVGRGPAHSVVLTPDQKLAVINVAGDDEIAFVDTASGKVVHRTAVGDFPCDMHLTPDGRYAFFPERDQDTLAKLNLETRKVVARSDAFESGSKPHMLRVDSHGEFVWVQTAKTNMNKVFDTEELSLLDAQRVGKLPTTNAWTPDGERALVFHLGDSVVSVFNSRPPFRKITDIEVGEGSGMVAFSEDGRRAYVTVRGENKVAVIDLASLEVTRTIPAVEAPVGIVSLDVRPQAS